MFWKWITPKTLGIVTQSSVYHWSIEGKAKMYCFVAFYFLSISLTVGHVMLYYVCSIDDTFLSCEFNAFIIFLI